MLASRILFALAFGCYLVATVLYVIRLVRRGRPRPISGGEASAAQPQPPAAPSRVAVDRYAAWGSRLMIGGILFQAAAIITRWMASGVAPVSNMYEYMSLTGWSVMFFYAMLDRRHHLPSLGAFVAPIGVVVIAYASVFPSQVQPLVPALQSYWLVLHVALAAFGEGAFVVGFVAALLYLLRSQVRHAWEVRTLEFTLYLGLALVAFIVLALGFKLGGYQVVLADARGPLAYGLPPLVAPTGYAAGELGSWLGLPLPLADAPAWLAGVSAARKLNTMVWSLIGGTLLYAIARLALRQQLWRVSARFAATMNARVLDEVSYSAIAAGFPLFTLGALVFGMVWAQKAWGSYWSWDPKETWALISWLFYAGYLHLRITRGWTGRPAAWAAVVAFVVVMFTLVGVNLLIVGLHSYA